MNGFYWLASYPKSGNTWLRLFLESLITGSNSFDINKLKNCTIHAASRSRFDRILDIESGDLTDEEITRVRPRLYGIEAQQAKSSLLSKVHDAWELTSAGEALFPPEVTLGAIYIVRDPRDVAVSMAHHVNHPIDKVIERMANPVAQAEDNRRCMPEKLPQRLLSWSRHVESWLNAPVKLLLLKYEDMLQQPEKCFGEAAHFLGFDASPDAIAAAVNAVRFDRLQRTEETNGFIEKPLAAARFFRRGIAGGWRDSLTPEQIQRIEADHQRVMKNLGYL